MAQQARPNVTGQMLESLRPVEHLVDGGQDEVLGVGLDDFEQLLVDLEVEHLLAAGIVAGGRRRRFPAHEAETSSSSTAPTATEDGRSVSFLTQSRSPLPHT